VWSRVSTGLDGILIFLFSTGAMSISFLRPKHGILTLSSQVRVRYAFDVLFLLLDEWLINGKGAAEASISSTFLRLCWQFLPDGIAIFCGLIMSTDGPYGAQAARVSTWWGVPCIIIAFIVVSTLQRGSARHNLSRIFLESPFLNLLGYISYPMCKYLYFVKGHSFISLMYTYIL
jgi:hypothetical protein